MHYQLDFSYVPIRTHNKLLVTMGSRTFHDCYRRIIRRESLVAQPHGFSAGHLRRITGCGILIIPIHPISAIVYSVCGEYADRASPIRLTASGNKIFTISNKLSMRTPWGILACVRIGVPIVSRTDDIICVVLIQPR